MSRKKFSLNCDLIKYIDRVPKEKIGDLFIHIIQYSNGLSPISNDHLVNLVFDQIKSSIDSDMLKPKSKKKTLEERREKFKKDLISFFPKYDKKIINEFYSYWTEKGDRDVKMRFEKEKTFSISRRLSRWSNNSFGSSTTSEKESFNINDY